MLVVCPKCFTQYVISNEIKVPEGQKFHCSACGNYFTLKSERQTGFYGDEAALEEEEIPTVSAVMNETNEKNTEVSVPTNTIPETNESKPEIEIKNESNREENREEKTEPVFSDVDSLALLANETPQASDRLDTLPEAFKPVETKKKKTSALGAIFWVCVAGAICYGAVYVLKQYPLMELTETFIASKLDKKNVSKTQKEATSSPAANTVAQPTAQPMPSAANEKNKSENSADKPMYIPPAKLDKPIITVEEVSARQEERQKQPTLPAQKETADDSQIHNQQPMPATPLGTPQQANQMQKPTQLMAQQAKARQQTTPSAENEASVPSAENRTASEAQKAARLLDEQLEQGAAADRLENEVAALATERNLMQSTQSDASVSASVESNAKPADRTFPVEDAIKPAAASAVQAPVEAAPNPPAVNGAQASVPTVPAAPTAPQPTENNQMPMNNEPSPQAENAPTAQMPAPAAQQADNVPAIPTQAPALSPAPTENVPLFMVDEPEQARQINTNEANRILKIQDIAYEISQNEAGVMRLMIKGSVANTELTKVVIPQLKAVVYDQNDTPVARKRIILSQPEIDGNSVQSFFSSVVPAPEQVSHVEVVFDE